MDATQPNQVTTDENLLKAFDDVLGIIKLKDEFRECHDFLAKRCHRLAELLSDVETRGVLMEQALEFIDVTFWLEMISWQTNFLTMVLKFGKRPYAKTLRPIVEFFGDDRKRMAREVEILTQQLKDQVTKFAKPDDKVVHDTIRKNYSRVVAAHLHIRSDYGGAELAKLFKVPRSTAYGWLEWFTLLPEGLREGILAYVDSRVPNIVLRQGLEAISKAGPKTAGGPTKSDATAIVSS
jgi:hypothetical protein